MLCRPTGRNYLPLAPCLSEGATSRDAFLKMAIFTYMAVKISKKVSPTHCGASTWIKQSQAKETGKTLLHRQRTSPCILLVITALLPTRVKYTSTGALDFTLDLLTNLWSASGRKKWRFQNQSTLLTSKR